MGHDNHDEDIHCHEDEAPCYYEHEGKKIRKRLWKYVSRIVRTEGPAHESYHGEHAFWVVQVHWQYDSNAIARGTSRASCVLDDEHYACVNGELAHQIRQGAYKQLNL